MCVCVFVSRLLTPTAKFYNMILKPLMLSYNAIFFKPKSLVFLMLFFCRVARGQHCRWGALRRSDWHVPRRGDPRRWLLCGRRASFLYSRGMFLHTHAHIYTYQSHTCTPRTCAPSPRLACSAERRSPLLASLWASSGSSLFWRIILARTQQHKCCPIFFCI